MFSTRRNAQISRLYGQRDKKEARLWTIRRSLTSIGTGIREPLRLPAGKYGSFLHALSWNILRSHHDAEECVNDTYFRAWNAMPPERPGALRAWLGRITRNLSLDRWKAGRTQSRGAGMETLLGELDECIPDHRGPEQAAEERVLAECVSAFLRGQTADNRYIFLRRYWYGEDIAAIAKRLDCGESRVKSVLFRTRKALRAFLEKEGITV